VGLVPTSDILFGSGVESASNINNTDIQNFTFLRFEETKCTNSYVN
jgi:hypothetical protein